MNNKTLKKLAMIGVASAIMLSVQEGEAAYKRSNHQGYIASSCGQGSCGSSSSSSDSANDYHENHSQYQQHQNQQHQQYQQNEINNRWNNNPNHQSPNQNLNESNLQNRNLQNGNLQQAPSGSSESASNTIRGAYLKPSYPANYSRNSFSPASNRPIADNEESIDQADEINKDDQELENASSYRKPTTQLRSKALSPRENISQKSPYKKINNQYYRTHITDADLESLDENDADPIHSKKLNLRGDKDSVAKPAASKDALKADRALSPNGGAAPSPLKKAPSAY